MHFDPSFGKIYDTIFFFIEYFNKDELEKKDLELFDESKDRKSYYQKIAQEVSDIPVLLSPLFYISDNHKSSISTFFLYNFNFSNSGINDFILKLSANSSVLYQHVVDTFFEGTQESQKNQIMPTVAPGAYIDAINSADFPNSLKLQLSLLLSNFSYAILILTEWLQKIYALVDHLHHTYRQEIELEFQRINTPKFLLLCENKFGCKADALSQMTASISILNPYVLQGRALNRAIIFGLKYKHDLDNGFDESQATAKNFCLTCGNEIRFKIVTALLEQQELTATQISKLIHVPTTSMIRHISTLQESGLIYVSRREKLRIYYRLNEKLLKRIKADLDKMLSSIT